MTFTYKQTFSFTLYINITLHLTIHNYKNICYENEWLILLRMLNSEKKNTNVLYSILKSREMYEINGRSNLSDGYLAT